MQIVINIHLRGDVPEDIVEAIRESEDGEAILKQVVKENVGKAISDFWTDEGREGNLVRRLVVGVEVVKA